VLVETPVPPVLREKHFGKETLAQPSAVCVFLFPHYITLMQ